MTLFCVGRPIIMGILNVTPDSFSDGGQHYTVAQAVAHAKKMIAEGADIIDIGGESTRPGAQQVVSVQEELHRVLPVITILRQETNIPISIDTCKPEVMQAAIAAGASLINDVYALKKPGALAAAATCEVPICLMHMQNEPHNMQDAPVYENILEEIKDFFKQRIAACESVGIKRERLILDPGFGFGKTVQHNMFITKNLHALKEFDLPILFGASRKTSIGAILNKPESQRLYGSIAAAVLAVANGANIIRVHDVAATKDALMITQEILSA